MPFPGAARGRRVRWPLLAAWAVSVASLVAAALLPRAAAHAYGAVLLGWGRLQVQPD
jgi:hypothetical protein